MPAQHRRKKILLTLMAWIIVTLLIIGYRNQTNLNGVVKHVMVNLDSRIHTQFGEVRRDLTTEGDGCRGFTDDPMDPAIVKYFQKKPTMKCKNTSPNFLYFTEGGDYLKINREKIKSLKFKVDYCKYAVLRRHPSSDFQFETLALSKSFTESISVPSDVNHIWGQCYQGPKVVGTSYLSFLRKNSTLENILSEDYDKHVKKESPKETLSVLIIGIDGTSKLNFARQMPKTKSFVLKMGGIEIYKVNKVGLNTFPNVMPMLTGYSEEQVRKNWTDKDHFDKIDHLFLWEEARKKGYRTSMILDSNKITSFHYMKQGWSRPKFHYYYRPVVLKSLNDKNVRSYSRNCIGDTHEVTHYYDYWLQLTKAFNNSQKTPYFGYSFCAHVTHDDINMASTIDEIYLDVFKKLFAQNSLNNTLVLFFSDHGCRYGKFRSTFKGMLEDSNPFMFFIFPPWFEAKYPKIMSNFRKNQHRVMTNFDIHATLKDILNFQGDEMASRPPPANKTHGLSLFQELPKRRTCEEAWIPIKYCNCRNFTTAGITPNVTEQVSKQFVKEVVEKSNKSRAQCAALTLNSTVSLMAIFTTSQTEDFYQATIHTSPGDAVYEATLKKSKKTQIVSVVGDIARTNMYRGQADCITDARVQPYCYCKNLL